MKAGVSPLCHPQQRRERTCVCVCVTCVCDTSLCCLCVVAPPLSRRHSSSCSYKVAHNLHDDYKRQSSVTCTIFVAFSGVALLLVTPVLLVLYVNGSLHPGIYPSLPLCMFSVVSAAACCLILMCAAWVAVVAYKYHSGGTQRRPGLSDLLFDHGIPFATGWSALGICGPVSLSSLALTSGGGGPTLSPTSYAATVSYGVVFIPTWLACAVLLLLFLVWGNGWGEKLRGAAVVGVVVAQTVLITLRWWQLDIMRRSVRIPCTVGVAGLL